MAEKKRTFKSLLEGPGGDKVVLTIAMMLILISIVCIFSSTSRLLTHDQTRLDIVRGQLMLVAGGGALIFLCYIIKNIKFYRWCSKWGFLLSMALLVPLVCKVNLGFVKSIEINEARRILQVGGVQIHVFEVVKIAMVMYTAWALDALKKGELKGPWKTMWKKVIYIYVPFVTTFILVLPGSNSAALFIGGILFVEILLGGGNFKDMALLTALAAVVLFICLGIYRISGERYMKRIGTGISRVFDDVDYEQKVKDARFGTVEYYDALDRIRQPFSAKIAVKEGGLFGKGPGQSTQRYVVPDISEDYMFSFIVEEYGLFGAFIVVFLYVSLMARGAIIAKHSGTDLFAKLSVGTLCLLITGQAFLHMFVNVDIGPMTGQTLPLISHGNSAFLCFSLAFGIILSFSRIAERRIEKERLSQASIIYVHEDVGDAVSAVEDAALEEYDDEEYYGN